MRIKRMHWIIIIILLVITTSACNKTKELSEPIEIHFQSTSTKSMSSGGPMGDPINDAIANYHKLNPLITIILDYLPESLMKQIDVNGEPMTSIMFTFEDMVKLLESNAPPDIISISPGDLPLAESKDLLYNLLQISGAKKMDINKQILDLATINGKLLTLPYAANPNAIFFNKNIFDEAHIPYPQGDWTWEEFRDVSKKLGATPIPMLT
ncbi:extracellular solute-binding protein [Paenibacillus psychroresistens]|uniref:Extracellular solute-binding protein n=1 Tax=Paenibacillus psychroresistens TaxID=1778678 RepID=A0A6B8RSB3_9BACL|nr:extracellular solute-binding protein [Paenibacillus psychroresistens]QGQ99321.1 extracellular solute-binding protein [Paenibacillus psychroresistens]